MNALWTSGRASVTRATASFGPLRSTRTRSVTPRRAGPIAVAGPGSRSAAGPSPRDSPPRPSRRRQSPSPSGSRLRPPAGPGRRISARWMPRPRASGRTAAPPSQATRRRVNVAATPTSRPSSDAITSCSPFARARNRLVRLARIGAAPDRPEPATKISLQRSTSSSSAGSTERIASPSGGGTAPRPPEHDVDRPGVDARRLLGDRPRPRRIVEPGDHPAGRARIGVEGPDLRQHDRDLAEPERAVEGRAREVAARGRRELAAVEDPDIQPGRRGSVPQREPRLALDAVEQVELPVERGGRLRRGRQDPDRIALADDTLARGPARTSANRRGGGGSRSGRTCRGRRRA